VNCPYFHVLAGLGFSRLQFGHLVIMIMITTLSGFVCLSLKVFKRALKGVDCPE
jgi:hypothetical protein